MMQEQICLILFFLSEAVTAWLYFEYLLEAKTKTWVRMGTFFLGYAIWFGVYQLRNTLLNALLGIFINTVLSLLNYRCNGRSAILHGAFLEFCIFGTEVIVNLLLTATGVDFDAFTYDVSALCTMGFTSKLLYLGVVLIATRFFASRKYKNETPRSALFFCSIPVISIAVSLGITWIGFFYEMNRASRIMMIGTVFSLLVINLLFLALYKHLQKAQQEQVSLELSLQKEKADTAYYQALQEQYQNQRILIHDIKNHLSTIAELAGSEKQEEIISYVRTLEAEVLPSGNTKYCDEPILNMMLLRYAEACKKKHVELRCDIRVSTAGFMDPASITTLYGNLLSNALEAAEQMEGGSIEILVKRNQEPAFVVISVINSSASVEISGDSECIPATRKRGSYHGLGLKSIQRVVRKYHGDSTMYYDAGEQKFHHVIRLPIE